MANKTEAFGCVLLEKPGNDGLTIQEVNKLAEMLGGIYFYPIELYAHAVESCALGLISVDAACAIEYDYENSGLHDYVASILDDMDNEHEDCRYQFKGVEIWLGRSLPE